MRLRKERTLPKPRIYSEEELAAMIAEDESDGDTPAEKVLPCAL